MQASVQLLCDYMQLFLAVLAPLCKSRQVLSARL